MSPKDYYQILGLDKNATPEQIRQAYRKLAFQYHPDRNQSDAAATEKMKAINEAYATISDPVKRREYDSLRERYGDMASERFRQTHSAEDIFRGSDISQVMEEFARMFGFRSSEELFKDFYDSGLRGSEFRRTGQHGRAYVFYASPRGRPEGNGEIHPAQPEMPVTLFPGVLGRMMKYALKMVGVRLPERGKDLKDVISLTSGQAERGGEVEYIYDKNGRPRKLMVKIPSGTKSGQRIRLRGMGTPGQNGGTPGDLYLQVRIKRSLIQRIMRSLRGA